MSKWILEIEIDDVDDDRFREEIAMCIDSSEGITIRTAGRKFLAEVTEAATGFCEHSGTRVHSVASDGTCVFCKQRVPGW